MTQSDEVQVQVQEVEETQETQPVIEPIPWVRDDFLGGERLSVGPWVAVVTDAAPMPPSTRLAGRFVSRGFLKHASGKALSHDFGGNTGDEARLSAKRWALGSIQMWGQVLLGQAVARPGSVIPKLPLAAQQPVVEVVFHSIQREMEARQKEREAQLESGESRGGDPSIPPGNGDYPAPPPARRRARHKRARGKGGRETGTGTGAQQRVVAQGSARPHSAKRGRGHVGGDRGTEKGSRT